MRDGRSEGATYTVLRDGRVLVAGGENGRGETVASAEIYDPGSGVWTGTGSMLAARRGHVAVLLLDGRVLVTGGWNLADRTGPPAFAELFDPSTGAWTKAGTMWRWRYGPKAIRLDDGRVLLLGGLISGGGETRSAEIFDPATTTWRLVDRMSAPAAAVAPAHGRPRPGHARGALGRDLSFDA